MQFSPVIPEIDIWRAANLMSDAQALRREGARGEHHPRRRTRGAGDHNGAATWPIINAVGQLANNTPPGPVLDEKEVGSPYLQSLAAGSTNSRAMCSSPAIMSCSVVGLPEANKAISS